MKQPVTIDDTFAQLFATIRSRKRAKADVSYTAQLFARGVPTICKKLNEETTEAIIEAARGDKARLREESADILYHLFVLWAASGITPEQVGKILSKRTAQSGLAEKAARTKQPKKK